MPTSLKMKIAGMARQTTGENSHRESKTISFANKDHYEEIFASATPGLRPAEISIDERHEDAIGQSLIPELKNEGHFIRTHSPIKEYDLSNLEPPKVPNYRVTSIANQKKDIDMSTSFISNSNQTMMHNVTTSQCHAACKGRMKCELCTSTVRRDDKQAQKNLDVKGMRPADDLIEKYYRSNNEQANEAEANIVLGLFGIQ